MHTINSNGGAEMNFSEFIKNEREQMGINIKYFSIRSGFNKKTITLWENGETIPTIRSVRKLAKALKWSNAKTTKALDIVEDERERNKVPARDYSDLINRFFAVGKELNMTQKELAEEVGGYGTLLSGWKSGRTQPSDKHVKQIIKFLNNKNQILKAKEKAQKLKREEQIYYKDLDDRQILGIEDYKLIWAIEEKCKHLSNCPDDDPILQNLHERLNVKVRTSKYDKDIVEQLRIENNLSYMELSEAIGYGRSWYNQFRAGTFFSTKHAEKFAKVFDVPVEAFEIKMTV